MQRLRIMALATMVVLMAGASFSTQAQKRTAPVWTSDIVPVSEVLNGTYTSDISATQLSTGTVETASNEVYGWTSYGKTDGDLPGYVFLSVNYSMPAGTIYAADQLVPLPVLVCQVSGGSWSRLIFDRGVYVGSVSGKITGGSITWDSVGESAQVSFELAADNGTEAFVGSSGSGSFEGSLDRTPRVPVLTGKMILKY
jgi:hypothetical protein